MVVVDRIEEQTLPVPGIEKRVMWLKKNIIIGDGIEDDQIE